MINAWGFVGREPPTVNLKHGKVVFEYTCGKFNAIHNCTEMCVEFNFHKDFIYFSSLKY